MKSNWKAKLKSGLKIAAYLAVGYLLVIGLMTILQNKLIFHPSVFIVDTPEILGVPWSEHYIPAEDGIDLHGWLLVNPEADHTVIFSHGNAGNISGRLSLAKTIYDAGASVFLYDYRGFGNSDSSPTEKSMYRDANAVISYLGREADISTDEMIFYGRSLGGPVAAYMASEYSGAGLVLDSSFTNLKAIAKDVMPIVPSFLIQATFPTDEYLKKSSSTPLMIMHSVEDELIGFHHGEGLYEIADQPKTFVELRGGHNDSYYVSKDSFEAGWENFIEALKTMRN